MIIIFVIIIIDINLIIVNMLDMAPTWSTAPCKWPPQEVHTLCHQCLFFIFHSHAPFIFHSTPHGTFIFHSTPHGTFIFHSTPHGTFIFHLVIFIFMNMMAKNNEEVLIFGDLNLEFSADSDA